MVSQVPHDEVLAPNAERRTADEEGRPPSDERQSPESAPRFGVRSSKFALPPDVVEPIAAAARDTGVEVYHAEISGRELRIQVESPSGASVRACTEFSHALTAKLDDVSFLHRQYTIEVSTPGIERRLYQPQDYAKAVNRHVKVLARDGWVEGLLEAASPNGITIKVQAPNAERRTSDGELTREIAYSEIREAHIRVSDSELFARTPAERK